MPKEVDLAAPMERLLNSWNAFLEVEFALWRSIEKYNQARARLDKANYDVDELEWDTAMSLESLYAEQLGRKLIGSIDRAHYYKDAYGQKGRCEDAE